MQFDLCNLSKICYISSTVDLKSRKMTRKKPRISFYTWLTSINPNLLAFFGICTAIIVIVPSLVDKGLAQNLLLIMFSLLAVTLYSFLSLLPTQKEEEALDLYVVDIIIFATFFFSIFYCIWTPVVMSLPSLLPSNNHPFSVLTRAIVALGVCVAFLISMAKHNNIRLSSLHEICIKISRFFKR